MPSAQERLQEILKTMDVPAQRTTDVRWLLRNIQFRNAAHPDFDEAQKLLLQLRRSENK